MNDLQRLTLTMAEWEAIAHVAEGNQADLVRVREQPSLGSDEEEFSGIRRGRRAYVVTLRGKKDGLLDHERVAIGSAAPFEIVMLMVAPAKESGAIDWVLLSDKGRRA